MTKHVPIVGKSLDSWETASEQASASVGRLPGQPTCDDDECVRYANWMGEQSAAQARQIAELKDEADRMAQGYLDEAKAAKRAEAKIAAYRALLKQLGEWDVINGEPSTITSDGPYWKAKIRAALEEPQGE